MIERALLVRDKQELISERIILDVMQNGLGDCLNFEDRYEQLYETYADNSPKKLASEVAAGIVEMINESGTTHDKGVYLSLLRNAQFEFYERNRNDRIYTSPGIEGAYHIVRRPQSKVHNSDHTALVFVEDKDSEASVVDEV